MVVVMFLAFFVLLFLGVPVALAMGCSALIAIVWDGGLPLLLIPQQMFSSLDSFSLLAVPLYIVAGEVMEGAGISQRLVGFASALVGHLRGGVSHVSVVTTMIFSGVSGSGAADVAAVGSLLVPAMVKRGFPAGFAAALQAATGTMGPLIPPSVLMIIYGSMVDVSVAGLFLGGTIPGVLVGLGLMLVNYVYAIRNGWAGEPRVSLAGVLRSTREASWALVMPLLILGGLLSGVFTATEAGVIGVAYAFLVGLAIYRELAWRDIPDLLVRSAVSATNVMIIVSAAGIFGWVLAKEKFGLVAVKALLSITTSPPLVMLLLIGLILLVGCFVEVIAATIVLVPVLAPVGVHFGFDQLHFAIVMIFALALGAVTPPVGVYLYITTAIAKCPFRQTVAHVWPYLGIMTAVLLLVAYVPSFALWLPRLMR